jgi:glycosyltransferase involved in cell wall biosynthesis
MRIAVDARELLGRPTGVGRYLAELLARWTRSAEDAPHEVVLVTPVPLDRAAPWRGSDGARIRDVVTGGQPGTWWEQGSLARATSRLECDVLFCPAYTAPLATRRPIVVTMHDVSFAARPGWFTWREAVRRRVLARASARKARAVLTPSRFSRDEIVRHLHVDPGKVHVVPQAVDSHACFGAPRRAWADPSAPREPVVLYVGSIFNRRRLPDLIAGFGLIARARPDLRLEVVGDDRTFPPQDLAGLAAATGVGAQIALRAYVPQAALDDLYSRARVFAFLSEYEGFGITPLEAMQAGVPVVALETPVAREVYREAALYVRAGDAAGLAEALGRLLDDGPARLRALAAGRAVVSGYSWDRTARQTMAVLEAAARPAR